MKPAQTAELPDTQLTPAVDSSKSGTQYATVYTFYVYDHDQGKPVIYPRMATPAAIAKMRGKMNEDTAWIVDAATLDIEGFYSSSVADRT